MRISPGKPWSHQRRFLFLLLVFASVRGLLYLVMFPPWQHYDEPTHFEYVRLIAERGTLPQPDEYDLQMRREIASSMQAAGFWKDLRASDIDLRSETPPSIGVSELEHPPLYYALLALPQSLVAHQSVETQLYFARLTSLCFYLLVVASAFCLVLELFPWRPFLPLTVATFIVLLTPFTALMSAVNNDGGATAAASLFFWAAVRLVRRGPSRLRVAATLLLAVICVATKSTAGLAALAGLLTLAVGYTPRALRRWLWLGSALLLPVALAATFTWGGHAAYWQSHDEAAPANRVVTDSVVGQAAFALSSDSWGHPRVLFQELRSLDGKSIRGHTVTLGAWLRATEGTAGLVTLSLDDGLTDHQHQVAVSSDWQFHAYTATIGNDAPTVAIYVMLPEGEAGSGIVHLDGVVLVDGEMFNTHAPQFETAAAKAGWWGTQPFTNLVRNGSAEMVWPGLRAWVGNMSLYSRPVAHVFHSVWDWQRTHWVYGPEFSILFQTFWGRVGWSHLAMPTAYFSLLAVVTIAALVGSGLGLVRWLRSSRRKGAGQGLAMTVLVVAVLVSWTGAVLRIHPVFATAHVYWPVARYASAAIVPTCLILCLGLAEIVPRRWLREAAWLGLLGMLALDTMAMWTLILPYYYG